jgi:crotonobetainyl-CoA:carnitine CoA-transferase CaiB-like acyl-CoA transferase
MPGPMEGYRVVELAFWVAGPSAAGILADWGAEVVKVEPPDGDPMRAIFVKGFGAKRMTANPPFELDNRGKRSIAVNLQDEEARRVVLELVDRADVFVTNFRPRFLERIGLDWPSLEKRNPRLVYVSITGYGIEGADRDRAGYDIGAFWSRAGIAASLTPPGSDPPFQRGAFGDHMVGLAGAAGASAALLAREKSGRGQLVATSLLRTGIFTMGWDTMVKLRVGLSAKPVTRKTVQNPMMSCYQAGDGRWFWLLGLQGDRMWPDLLRAIGRSDLVDDARFATLNLRREHAVELVDLLDEIFAAKPRDEWVAAFDRENVWWSPVATTDEVVEDPQAIASGAFVDAPLADGTTARSVSTPIDFSATPWSVSGPPPELAQHTEEILLELGYDWERIGALRERGAIP